MCDWGTVRQRKLAINILVLDGVRQKLTRVLLNKKGLNNCYVTYSHALINKILYHS